MKRFFFLVPIFLVVRASALPAFDPFADATATNGATSYTVGSALGNQTNAFLQGWAPIGTNFVGPQPTIVAGNLSYPGLPPSSGNSVSFVPAATAMGARLNLQTNGNSGTFYYSYILQITNIDAVPVTSTNNGFAGFSDSPVAQGAQLARLGTRVLTKQTNGGFVLGLGRNSVVADFAYDTNVFNVNDVLFIVGSYELIGGVTNVNLWINPPTNTFGLTNPPTPTLSIPTYTGTGGALNSSGVAAFVINCQFPTAPSGIIDELRVEKNWKYVTGGDPAQPIIIEVQPSSRKVMVGDKVGFGVGITGTTPSYQWLSNGVPIPGATQSGYSLTNVQTNYAADYSVIVSNFLNSVTSAPATLTVLTNPLRIYNTNLVVIRVGDGAQTPTVNGNSMFLDQFTTSGAYLNTFGIPDDGASAMVTIGLNVTGSSLTGSCLTRSADQRLLVVGGYNTTLAYGANLKNSVSATVPRGIAVIDTHAQYTLAVANTDYASYSQTYWRGGVTDNGTNFWGAASGSGGTYYFGFENSPTLVGAVFGNVRSIAIFNGSIYCVSAVSGNNGVLKFDAGMPTNASSSTILFPGSTSSSDLEVSPNGNLIYVADDRVSPNGGVQRWQFDGSIWTRVYTLTNGLPTGAQYVTADFSGPTPVVYAVTAGESNNRLVAIADTGESSIGTTLASAGANQTFRGLRFGPAENAVVPQPTLFFTREGDNVILNWSDAFILQSATNVAGPYNDVSGATSPHTNSAILNAQEFFQLRD